MIVNVLILLFLQLFQSSQAQLKFDQANQLLKEQDYTGAIKGYKEIIAGDWKSGALFLNIGLAYTQLDSLGMAKAYFLQASKFDETQTEALKGIEYTIKKLPQKAAYLPKLPWDYVLDWTIKLGTTGWSWLTMAFAYITLILLVLYWFLWRGNTWAFRSFLASLLVTAALASSAFYTDYVNYRYGNGVLIKEQSNLLKSPDPEAEVTSITFEGYEFIIDFLNSKNNPDWVYVRMSNGIYGWIPKSDLIIY
jgi:tetratricopeptide (TPR) repeat protein